MLAIRVTVETSFNKKIIDAENMAAPWSRQVSSEVEERRFQSFNAIHWNEIKLVFKISNLNNTEIKSRCQYILTSLNYLGT
jgi:hypothetical protein